MHARTRTHLLLFCFFVFLNESIGVSAFAVSSLTLLHQLPVVWHDLALGEVKTHLQGDQHRELQRNQLSSADAETLLQLLRVCREREKQNKCFKKERHLVVR